jgi:hypothetical protein
MKRIILCCMAISGLLILACTKQQIEDIAGEDEASRKNPVKPGNPTIINTVGRLSYGDTLFFLQPTSVDVLVNVVSKPGSTSKFKAIPGGLVIDSVTGRVNISKSESGVRYKIFAINSSGIVLDSVKIVVSGVDYKDEIFEIAKTTDLYDTSFPIYNARPGLAPPCSEDDDDEDFGCTFDETDLNDDGNDDIAGVNQDKLLVNKKTGTIDLEASFHAGIFGSSNPANGTRKDFVMYYRLFDASNRALQKINIRVYYYDRKSDIPQSLLNELAQRNNQQSTVNARTFELSYSLYESYEKPKRPPILIIVGKI